ncbi:hypothetical protein [Stygiolobus sp. CP859M]|jgi:hypothetical protein
MIPPLNLSEILNQSSGLPFVPTLSSIDYAHYKLAKRIMKFGGNK